MVDPVDSGTAIPSLCRADKNDEADCYTRKSEGRHSIHPGQRAINLGDEGSFTITHRQLASQVRPLAGWEIMPPSSDDGGRCKSRGWAQIRGWPAECTCPPLQPNGDMAGHRSLCTGRRSSRGRSRDLPVRFHAYLQPGTRCLA
jgi:hypothetical protein